MPWFAVFYLPLSFFLCTLGGAKGRADWQEKGWYEGCESQQHSFIMSHIPNCTVVIQFHGVVHVHVHAGQGLSTPTGPPMGWPSSWWVNQVFAGPKFCKFGAQIRMGFSKFGYWKYQIFTFLHMFTIFYNTWVQNLIELLEIEKFKINEILVENLSKSKYNSRFHAIFSRNPSKSCANKQRIL